MFRNKVLRLVCIAVAIGLGAQHGHGRAWAATKPSQRGPADSAEAQAREMFRRAEVHFNLREFDRALQLYAEAYRLKPLPGFLFNIAQCHRFSGRFEDAAFSYRVYLQRAPDAPNRAEAEALVRAMEDEARKSPRAQSSSGSSGDEPASGVRSSPAVVSAPPASQDHDTSTVSVAVWSVGAVGLALLGAGVVTGQLASDRSDEYNDGDTPDSKLRSLADSGRALAITSAITLSAGALALATAGVLWLQTPARQPKAASAAAPTVAFATAPTRDGIWLGLQGAFQ